MVAGYLPLRILTVPVGPAVVRLRDGRPPETPGGVDESPPGQVPVMFRARIVPLAAAAAFLCVTAATATPAEELPQPASEESPPPAGPVFISAANGVGVVLQDVRLRAVGGRQFLVGEEVANRLTKTRFRGGILWIPLDAVSLLVEIADAKAAAGDDEVSVEQPTAPESAAESPLERLERDILQREDKELRGRRLDELSGMLVDPRTGPGERAEALGLLARLGNIPFDRTPFLPAVRPLLGSPLPAVRRAALAAMPAAGADETDLPALAALAGDESAAVRAGVVSALYAAAGDGGMDIIDPVVERLLADSSDEVRLATLHALWGHPVSPAAERQIIDLSHESRSGGPGALGYDAIYYALSTRPVVCPPVARRLIELMRDPELDPNVRWRAAWGLGHAAAPDAVDLVVQALIAELDETLHPTIRDYAVRGLTTHRTPAALAKLRELAERDEDQQLRETAAEAVESSGENR